MDDIFLHVSPTRFEDFFFSFYVGMGMERVKRLYLSLLSRALFY
jgi:hypothetical protein